MLQGFRQLCLALRGIGWNLGKQRKALIEIFVNAIFLYDDRMLITFNYKDGTQIVRFEDALTADGVEGKSSDLSSSAGAAKYIRSCKRFLSLFYEVRFHLLYLLSTLFFLLPPNVQNAPSFFLALI